MPNVSDILESIGIPKEDATKILALSEEDQKTFDTAPYTQKVRENYHTQFQNDPTFFDEITVEKLPVEVKKKIESSQYGRASNIVRDKFVKGLGMTEDDYADLTDEEKNKLELFIPKMTEKYSKTKAGDKEMQSQLIEARKKLEAFGPDYEKNMAEKYQGESDLKIKTVIFNANLISELSSIPNLKIPAADLAKSANDILLSKYGFEKVGDYGIELRQKDKPAMKVLKNGTSKELTLKDALTEIAVERGWAAKEDEGGEKDKSKGSGTYQVRPDGKGELTIVSPHLKSAIDKKIAEESDK